MPTTTQLAIELVRVLRQLSPAAYRSVVQDRTITLWYAAVNNGRHEMWGFSTDGDHGGRRGQVVKALERAGFHRLPNFGSSERKTATGEHGATWHAEQLGFDALPHGARVEAMLVSRPCCPDCAQFVAANLPDTVVGQLQLPNDQAGLAALQQQLDVVQAAHVEFTGVFTPGQAAAAEASQHIPEIQPVGQPILPVVSMPAEDQAQVRVDVSERAQVRVDVTEHISQEMEEVLASEARRGAGGRLRGVDGRVADLIGIRQGPSVAVQEFPVVAGEGAAVGRAAVASEEVTFGLVASRLGPLAAEFAVITAAQYVVDKLRDLVDGPQIADLVANAVRHSLVTSADGRPPPWQVLADQTPNRAVWGEFVVTLKREMVATDHGTAPGGWILQDWSAPHLTTRTGETTRAEVGDGLLVRIHAPLTSEARDLDEQTAHPLRSDYPSDDASRPDLGTAAVPPSTDPSVAGTLTDATAPDSSDTPAAPAPTITAPAGEAGTPPQPEKPIHVPADLVDLAAHPKLDPEHSISASTAQDLHAKVDLAAHPKLDAITQDPHADVDLAAHPKIDPHPVDHSDQDPHANHGNPHGAAEQEPGPAPHHDDGIDG